MKSTDRIAGIVALAILISGAAFAGAGNRTGTNGASELLIPVGARAIAMAGTSISTGKGVEALYWNPAAVGRMANSASVYVSHMTYLADLGVNYAAVAANFQDVGVLSVSVKSISIGEIPVTTNTDPDGTGQIFTPQFFTVGLSYSRQLSDRIAVGLTANLITEDMGNVNATGVGFDVGVLYDNLGGLNGLSIGVVVHNIGPQMQFDGSGMLVLADVGGYQRPAQFYEIQAAPFELPTSIEFGLGYRAGIDALNSIQFAGIFQSNNFSDDEYRVGAEYSFQDIVFLRGGYAMSQAANEAEQYIFGPSFGGGVRMSLGSVEARLDYAYRSTEFFDGNHVLALTLGF